MSEPSELSQYIESFVDASRSSTQQAAGLEAISYLLKKDVLTIGKLVREMEMYLTTTDNVIRARGILLLGELLKCLSSKPLDSATIHSLIGFFTERLADWRAVRGALVGCLALMRRKRSFGSVTNTDAEAVAKSYLQNLPVQSLGQHDRKLCFELLECLLECYPEAVASLGDELVYGICEAFDGEKDPQCLMLTFHIVEILARLFPDPCGLLASFAGDLFDILGCYFPVHFTHSKGEEVDVKRDDLSRALMLAISSTPLFEPFAIPLFLEKLSSSLPVAKVDSLKYLSFCTLKYGAERVAKHYGTIWPLLKDAISTSHETTLSFTPESLVRVDFQENEITTEALDLLQKLVMQDTSFLSFIVGDVDINTIFNTITSYHNYEEVPLQSKQKLHTIGQVLSVCIKASITSCNQIFESFFPRLVDILGAPMRSSSGDCSPDDTCVISRRLNNGAVYLCIEFISASRDLILGSEGHAAGSGYAHEIWCILLKNFSASLTQAFVSAITMINEDACDADIYLGVKGLLILGTFPGGYLLISKSVFEKILTTLLSVVTADYNNTLAWKLALKALVQIGSFIHRFHESEKALSYMGIVVERLVSLGSLDDFSMPFALRLEAISDIGTSGLNYMLKIVQGLEDAICARFPEVLLYGNSKSIETVVQLLECFSLKVLPRIDKIEGLEDVLLQFTVSIWDQIENCKAFNLQIYEKGIFDAAMMAMKLIVASLSVQSQNIVIQKACGVLSSTTFHLKASKCNTPVELLSNMSKRDEWILSLFASVIIAVCPQAQIPNVQSILHLFMSALLKGHIPAGQALGSMVNKMALNSDRVEASGDCLLDEAMDIIFNTTLSSSYDECSANTSSGMSEIDLKKLCCGVVKNSSLQMHAIVGLAWIGKGLLMRGHEKVKDINMIFLDCLLSSSEKDVLHVKQVAPDDSSERHVPSSVMKCAADAFQILMSDSEMCLNRKFHAVIRPLYKQRFFSTMVPIMRSLIVKSGSSVSRSGLHRAFAHIVTETPLSVILSDAKKLTPVILDGLSALNHDILDKDIIFGLLLVLSGILTDKSGQEAVVESAHVIVNCLIVLIAYPHMMIVRKTAIQCLVAVSGLPYTRIYPLRTQVLQAISKALDDPKRTVRQEAVRCRQAWASIASRSLHF